MPKTATRKRRWPLWLLGIVAVLLLLYAIAGFLVLPWWLEQQLPKQAEQHLGWRADVTEVAANPFVMSVTLSGFTATDPDGEPIADVENLHLNLSFLRFFVAQVQVDELRIQEPRLRLEIGNNGQLNVVEHWRNHSPLAATPAEGSAGSEPADGEAGGEQGTGDDGLPLIIESASLKNGKILLRDHRTSETREFNISPLDLNLSDVAVYTEPGETGHYELTATLGDNQYLNWVGNLELMPFRSWGRIQLENIRADALWHFVGREIDYDWRAGVIDLEADYSVDTAAELQFALQDGQLEIRDSTLFLSRDREAEPALHLTSLDAQRIRFDWPRSQLQVGDVSVADWTLALSRDEDGEIDWITASDEDSEDEESESEPGIPDEFSWRIQHLGLAQGTINWRDASLPETAELSLQGIEAELNGLTGAPDQPVGVVLQAAFDEGGQGRLNGEFTVSPFTLEASLQLSEVSLPRFQPYLGAYSPLELESGALGFDGSLSLDDQQPELTGSLDGNLVIDNLATRLPELDASFLDWETLRLERLQVNLKPLALDIRTLTLQSPELTYVRLEGDNSFARLTGADDVLEDRGAAEQDESAEKADTDGEDTPALRIAQVNLENGAVVIEDRTLARDFRLHVHEIGGGIVGISNRKPQRAQVSLRGLVAEQGNIRVEGEVGALGETDASVLEVTGDNIGLEPLSPYFVRYLGYTVEGGRLELDLDYVLEGDQIAGENEFVMQDFSLGENVPSDAALDVPVRLGIALLRGPEGDIELDVPVTGDLSDPQFNFSDVVLGAFANVVGRAARAPFSILGQIANLGDVSGEELGEVAFLPGTAELAPAETAKLEALARALQDRSGIALSYRGATAPEWDRPALVLANEGFVLPPGELEEKIRALEERLVEEEGEAALERLVRQYSGSAEERFQSSAWAQSLLYRLASGRSPEPGALRNLAEDRADALRQALLERGGIAPEQLRALETRNNADVDDGRVVIEFGIESR